MRSKAPPYQGAFLRLNCHCICTVLKNLFTSGRSQMLDVETDATLNVFVLSEINVSGVFRLAVKRLMNHESVSGDVIIMIYIPYIFSQIICSFEVTSCFIFP